MQQLNFMCPVHVSRPGLSAVVASQTSPLVSLLVIRAEVIILSTDALERQHPYQIAWSPFNQSVLYITSDACRVFDVEMSSLLASAVTLYATSFRVRPHLFVSCKFCFTSSAAFSMITFALKLLTVNATGSHQTRTRIPWLQCVV